MNVLAVGAHPDDIEYGCGGYLARLAKEHQVETLIGTAGERGGDPDVRIAESDEAERILGISSWGMMRYPDGDMPSGREAVDWIERIIQDNGFDCILVNTPDDTHQDHRAIASATLAAARRAPRVLCYHAPSSTRVFERVVCADITDTLETKCRALDAHASQARHRLAELARAEATFWGGRAGVRYAEAFEPVRWVL